MSFTIDHLLLLSLKIGSECCKFCRDALWLVHSSVWCSTSCCCSCWSTCCCHASGVKLELLCHTPWDPPGSCTGSASVSCFIFGGKTGFGNKPSSLAGAALVGGSWYCNPNYIIIFKDFNGWVASWLKSIQISTI